MILVHCVDKDAPVARYGVVYSDRETRVLGSLVASDLSARGDDWELVERIAESPEDLGLVYIEGRLVGHVVYRDRTSLRWQLARVRGAA